MDYLIGLLVALGLGFLYQRNRANTAEARNDNLEVKEELNNINKDISKNDGLLDAEEEKRKELQKQVENLTADTVTNIVDYLNKRDKK